MKIVAVNGSPRGKKSVTALLTEEFFIGAREYGVTTQQIFLSELQIHHCMECYHCWRKNGECIFKDDMATMYPIDADLLVLATPLFYDNVTGLMKNFLDRSVSKANPRFDADQQGISLHPRKSFSPPRLMAISNCGFPEQCHFDVLKLLFRRMARNMGVDLIGEIYRSQGPIFRNIYPEFKERVEAYKTLLQQAGKEIVTKGSISDMLQKRLEEPLVPYDLYIERHNRLFA